MINLDKGGSAGVSGGQNKGKTRERGVVRGKQRVLNMTVRRRRGRKIRREG